MEYLMVKVPNGAVNLKKVMILEETEVKGVVEAMGKDGFLTGQIEKAEKFENLKDFLEENHIDILHEAEKEGFL